MDNFKLKYYLNEIIRFNIVNVVDNVVDITTTDDQIITVTVHKHNDIEYIKIDSEDIIEFFDTFSEKMYDRSINDDLGLFL